jgi:hypothetical protein
MTRTTRIAFAFPPFEKGGEGGFAFDSGTLMKKKILLNPDFPREENV